MYDAAAPAGALDLSGVAGMTTLKLSNATTADAYTTAAGVNVQLDGMIDGEAVTLTGTATETSRSISVTNMGTIAGNGVTVNVDGAAVTTINIASTGTVAAGTDSDIVLASTGAETTVNVTGDGALALTTAATVLTLGATGFSGALTYVAGATTDDTSITTGAGADTVTAAETVDYTINLGAGNDTLITADTAGDLTTADSLNGGDGTDTIGVDSAVAAELDDNTAGDIAVLAKITNFEQLRIVDNLADDFTISRLGYNYLQVADDVSDTGSGVTEVTVSGFTSGATIEFRDAADMTDTLVVTMTGATNAGTTTDTLNLKLNANLAATNDFEYNVDIAGINIVNIVANDRDNSDLATDGTADGYTIDLDGQAGGVDSSLKTVNISGAAQVTYTISATSDALETVNGTDATGDLVISAAAFNGAQGVAITGGAGDDTLTGANGLADVIVGGAGNDSITGGTSNGDIMTGGAGTDTFVFTGTTTNAASSSVYYKITDFMTGNDVIDFDTALAVDTAADAATATAGEAVVSATGFATFHADDSTLALKLIAAAAATDSDGDFVIFTDSSNTYVYISGDTSATADADDVLIQLTGQTFTTSTLTSGNLSLG